MTHMTPLQLLCCVVLSAAGWLMVTWPIVVLVHAILVGLGGE